ncbi:alpha-tectorin-like [Pungitius pungitius]|uniref:alpha-tectorin-like n=1 Tax=Pungitius pungitius TaxID=134920 RepID=UPI002E10D4F7
MKTGALLLLLAVAASQVDVSMSQTFYLAGGVLSISSCPITFYGHSFSWMDVRLRDSLAICFLDSANDPPQNCVTLNQTRSNVAKVAASITVTPASLIPLPNITGTATCKVVLNFLRDAVSTFTITFLKFGPQTASSFQATTAPTSDSLLTAKVGNLIVDSWTLSPQQLTSKFNADLSSCRDSGVPIRYGEKLSDFPENCTSTVCSKSAVLGSVSSCDAGWSCLGNNTCEPPPPSVCTVTGSTLIDFHGEVHSVEDRCEYALMKSGGGPGVVLIGGFRERRRTDVSFLDYLTISQKTGDIHLEQGGRVRVGDQILDLNTTPQRFYGVELSKDQTGVTAKLSAPNMRVVFDGNTAHVSGPYVSLKGLCGNPTNKGLTTTLSAERISSAGCDTLHTDTIDSSINCSRSADRCELLNQPPFDACHQHIDTDAYVAACNNTLCVYPAVDGLHCQFLEAYAESCSLKEVPLGDWRTTVQCPAVPQVSCLDQYCSEHEFCGELLGEASCFCRALFASKFNPTNSLGEQTVCKENSATVTLAECLLQGRGINSSVLHLNDPNCKGHLDPQTHKLEFSFDTSNTCGAEVSMNNSQILYKNTIMTKNGSQNGVITRKDQVQIDFSCFYTKPDVQSLSFRIKDSSVVLQVVSGPWNYTLTMAANTDGGLQNLVESSTELQLNQKVWLQLKADGLDGDAVAMVTDSCWATTQPSTDSSPRYDLVIAGCPNKADQTVTVEGNGLGTSNVFSFNVFQFSGETSAIYLHCKVELCPKEGTTCAPTCPASSKRRRRSSRSNTAEGDPALITMAWSN